MAELRFIIDFPPQPKQRTANRIVGGRVKRYTPDETRTFEAKVAQLAWVAMTEQKVKRAIACPVSMSLHFHLGLPKSLSKKKITERIGLPHIIRPDLTNLAKSIEDGCNGVVYADDSQITSIDMRKVWGAMDQVEVTFSW